MSTAPGPLRVAEIDRWVENAQEVRNTCAVTTQPNESASDCIERLGAPNKDTLEHPPLELVVCQVRHEPVASVADAGLLPMFQQRLGHGFERFEPLTAPQQTFPAGLFQPGIVGWRLTNDDGWIVTLSTDAFSLECTKYTSWTTFRELITSMTALVSETYSPRLTQRVGLRYVDRFDRAGAKYPRHWDGLLHPAMLSFGTDDVLGSATIVSQTTNEMLIDGLRANVRGSIASDNTPSGHSFLLDTDCFDERSGVFNIDSIGEVVGRLHELNLRLFQHIVTDTLYNEIHG